MTDEQERRPPSRRTLLLLVVPIVAIVATGTVANAIHPSLINDRPLLLVAMEPRNRYLVLVAPQVEFVPFLLVATVRRLLSDPLFYALGFLYGDAAVRWMERRMGEGGGVIRAVERAFGRAAPVLVFLFPGALVCVLAGATRMKALWFVVLNVSGTVTAVSVIYQLAEVVEGPLTAVNRFYGDNSRWLTVVSIAFTAVWLVSQRRTGRGELQSVAEIERELTGEEHPRDPGAGDTRP